MTSKSRPPGMQTHPATFSSKRLLADSALQRIRRGGPGGQRRNKVETGVVLRHLPTGIAAEASERRHQRENLPLAVRRLRLNLAVGVRVPAADGPSPLWQRRCRSGRIVVSEDHQDFAAILAEALDTLAGTEWDHRAAATTLGCSPTQLVRLIGRCRKALELVNQRRAGLGLRTLK
ncbi:MAG: peptide chain release factor-like protein [Planctomycetaceae bacterium]